MRLAEHISALLVESTFPKIPLKHSQNQREKWGNFEELQGYFRSLQNIPLSPCRNSKGVSAVQMRPSSLAPPTPTQHSTQGERESRETI